LVGKELNATLERAQDVLRSIETLKPGDRVVVLWHDACRVTNDPDVRPEYYSTPKETQGTIFDCVPDPDFPKVFYLIVCGETTAGKPDYYDAIPIAWIAKIEKLEIAALKQPKKALKLATDLYTVKRVIAFKDARMVEDTGGITKLPLRWLHLPKSVPSHKFVEEIHKVVR
jgi:hypothetical protein